MMVKLTLRYNDRFISRIDRFNLSYTIIKNSIILEYDWTSTIHDQIVNILISAK